MRRLFFPRATTTIATISSSSSYLFAATQALVNNSTTRNIVIFTDQHQVLQNNAKHLNFTSPVWVEDVDKFWSEKLTPLKKNQKPTEISVQRMIDYYNLDCIADLSLHRDLPDIGNNNNANANANDDGANAQEDNNTSNNASNNPVQTATTHYSFASKAPFSKHVNSKLSEIASSRGYESRFWITASFVRSRKIALSADTRVSNILVYTRGRFYNAEQFANSDAITKTPFSAYKKMPYSGPTASVLRKDVETNQYPTGLYFTLGQLELFDLIDELKDDATPVEVVTAKKPFSSSRGMIITSSSSALSSQQENENPNQKNNKKSKNPNLIIYNISEVENGAALLDSLQRFPVEVDTFLVSGRPVNDENTLALIKQQRFRYPTDSKYWVLKRDLDRRGFCLKPEAEGIEFDIFTSSSKKNKKTSSSSSQSDESETEDDENKMLQSEIRNQQRILFFNVNQLMNPSIGYKISGTKTVS